MEEIGIIRILSFIAMLCGAGIMVSTTMRYRKLLKYNAEEAYDSHRTSWVSPVIPLTMMYIFIFGFFVGMADNLMRQVEPIYLFVSFIFFLGAVFINASVVTQTDMATMLRNKSMEVMRTFVNAIDMKDSYTKGHSQHVYQIVDLFYEALPEQMQHKIKKPKLLDAALLHDIGKLNIEDTILNKRGTLTEAEWEVIRMHPLNGKKMMDCTCFVEISDWVLFHHERIDGNGYYKIAKEDIPLESRIIAIADTYSALCTDRVYRDKCSHQDALVVMRDVAGTQLDAELLQVFFTISQRALQAIL